MKKTLLTNSSNFISVQWILWLNCEIYHDFFSQCRFYRVKLQHIDICNQISICSCRTMCCKFYLWHLFLQNESESISFGYKNLDFMMTSTIIKNSNRICIFKMNLNTQYKIINIWIYVFFFFDCENKILFNHHIKSGVKSYR